MRRALVWIAVALGALLVLALGAIAALPFLIDVPSVQGYIAQSASQTLGRPVTFGALSISAFPLPSVRLRGLAIADDPRFGVDPLATVREARIRIRMLPLLTGRVELADVAVDGARLEVVDAQGQLNIALLGPAAAVSRGAPRAGTPAGPAGAGSALAIPRMKITDAAVHYTRRGSTGGPVALEGVRLEVEAAPGGEAVLLRGEGVGRPGAVRVRISEASLGVGRAFGEAALKAVIDVEVHDVGPLGALAAPSPALSGSARGRLSVAGTLARPTASGAFRLERLVMAREGASCRAGAPRRLEIRDLKIPVGYTSTRLESNPVEARVSGGAVSADLVYTFAPSPLIALRAIGVKGLDLAPLLVDYLCQSLAVSGPLDLSGELTMRPHDPLGTLGGTARVRIGPGKVIGSDAVQLLGEALRLAGPISGLLRGDPLRPEVGEALEFDSITATVRIANGIVTTDDLAFKGKRLVLEGAGSYALVDGRTDMALRLTEGRTQVSARVAGVTPGGLRVIPTGVSRGGRDILRSTLERLFR